MNAPTTDLSPAQREKMSALLFLMSRDKFSILEVEALAKVLNPNMTFDLVGPKGAIPCRFVDPDYGVFSNERDGGTLTTQQLQFVVDVHCENLGDFE
jgi:hypothetical protein